MAAGSGNLSGSLPAAKKLQKMGHPAGIGVVRLPSVRVVASREIRLAPEAPGYRRNLQNTKLSYLYALLCVGARKSVTHPSRTYFSSFSKSSGESDCDRDTMAGQCCLYSSERYKSISWAH